jgi:guanylate kinase
LLARISDLELAVSATTREQRPGEEDGREYWFISDDEFDRRRDRGELLEWVVFPWGQRSATLYSEIGRIAAGGRVAVLELEPEGALRVKRRVAGSVTIFVDAPLPELERRLLERATESAGEIGERLRLAREQKEQAVAFDYVVVNDDVARAAAEVADIVEGELTGRLSAI